jgi:hypothetical protein
MGVFERLLRRSKATEEAVTADGQAAAQPAATEAQVAVEGEQAAVEGKGSSEHEGDGDGEATAASAEAATTEDVDIPKQQTAEQAADNDAGKGSRT